MTVTTPTLRPLGIGQLLDQAIRLYRRNFSTFIGIIAVVQIPLSMFSLFFALLTVGDSFLRLGTAQDPYSSPTGFGELFGLNYFLGMAGSLVVTVLSFILIQGVATGALTRAVADEYLGEDTGFVEAFRKLGRSWLTLVGALFVAGLVSIGLIIWFLIPCIGWFTGLGILAFFGSVVMPLIAPVVILEGESGRHALRRAWDLARRRFWWVVGFVAILYIFNQLVVAGPATLVNLALNLVSDSLFDAGNENLPFIVNTVAQSIVSLVFSLLYLPLQLTAMTLLYLDLRVRTEGLDLTLQAEGAREAEINIKDLLKQAPGPDQGQLVTSNEFGYFVVLSIGFGALTFLVTSVLGALGLALVGGF